VGRVRFAVEQRLVGGRVELSLVRFTRVHRRLAPDPQEAEVLARRRFDPRRRDEIADYVGRLETAAELAGRGELGCSVQASPWPDGTVRVELVERWLADDGRLQTEILASQRFDAARDDALVQSAELAEELRALGAQRNEERARTRLTALAAEDAVGEDGAQPLHAARLLARLLGRAG
jgi:hypothetical protein